MNISNQFSSSDKSFNSSQTNNISVTFKKIFPKKFGNKLNLKSIFNSRDNKYRNINLLSKENKSDYYTTNTNKLEYKNYKKKLI